MNFLLTNNMKAKIVLAVLLASLLAIIIGAFNVNSICDDNILKKPYSCEVLEKMIVPGRCSNLVIIFKLNDLVTSTSVTPEVFYQAKVGENMTLNLSLYETKQARSYFHWGIVAVVGIITLIAVVAFIFAD